MPVHKVKGGYQWGHQKVYKGTGARKKAAKQGRAVGWSKHSKKSGIKYNKA
jgi:hypothetical protein